MPNYNPPKANTRQVTPCSTDFTVDVSPTQNVVETQIFEDDIKKKKRKKKTTMEDN